MKKFLENYFYKKNYFIFTPKIHSFGGFFESFLFGTKIPKYAKMKTILAIPFIDIKNHYLSNSRKFDYYLILQTFLKFTIKEKILSILLSLYLNLNLLLKKLKIKRLLFFIIDKKHINNFFFENIGHNDDYNIYNINNIKDVHKERSDISIFYQDKDFIKKFSTKKYVALCVKDKNYNKIKPLSLEYCADINTYKKTIDFLIQNDFSVMRIGEPLMSDFNYTHPNYFDFTKDKSHYKLFFNSVQYSQFYFGTSASHSFIPEFFSKQKIITNSCDFLYLNSSFNYNNITIFKSCYSISQKKILSFSEIYQNLETIRLQENSNDKGYIFFDNSSLEILNLIKYHFEKKKNFDDMHHKNLMELHEMRIKYLEKNYFEKKKPSRLYQNAKTNILPEQLKNFLYPNKYLDELSKIATKKMNL